MFFLRRYSNRSFPLLVILVIFFCLAIFHFWLYGIDLGRWIPIYNGILVQQMRLPYASWTIATLSNITKLRFCLDGLNVHIYAIPLAVFVFSIITRMMQLVLLFFLFKCIINSDKTALFVTVVLSFASGILGLEIWGISGILVYDTSSVAFICILLSLNLLFRKKMLMAGLLLGIASLLEAPTGVAIFILLSAALSISFLIEGEKKKQILDIIWFLTGFLLIVFPMIYSYFVSNANLISDALTIKEWYHFLIVRSPGDALLSFTMWKYGPNIISLAVLYFAIRPKAKLIFAEQILIGIIVTFILILMVEILHAHGIFFGELSKLFISIQFQRSYILLPIMLVPLIGKAYLDYDFVANKNFGKQIMLFICFMIAILLVLQVYQYLSLILTVLSLVLLLLSSQSQRYKVSVFSACLLIIILYVMLPTEARQPWANIMEFRSLLFLMPMRFVAAVFFAVLFFIYLNSRLLFGDNISYISNHVFLWLLFIITAAFLTCGIFLNSK